MPWLRIDDGFTEHRKLLMLKRHDRWTWMEIMTYCARQNDGGHVPAGISSRSSCFSCPVMVRCGS